MTIHSILLNYIGRLSTKDFSEYCTELDDITLTNPGTPGGSVCWQEVVRMPEVVVPLTIRDLTVEETNPRARALYERLGYVAYGREPDAWDEEAPDGSISRYETMCTLMRKELPPPS